LGLSWSNAEFIGGAGIIDHRISIAQSGGSFTVLASNVVGSSYLATELTAGVTYQFKVESRNSYGFSVYSSSISLLCAFKPEAPLTITTSNSGNQVRISWSSPTTNGYPISAYKIYI
jgi:hypothetical protein